MPVINVTKEEAHRIYKLVRDFYRDEGNSEVEIFTNPFSEPVDESPNWYEEPWRSGLETILGSAIPEDFFPEAEMIVVDEVKNRFVK